MATVADSKVSSGKTVRATLFSLKLLLAYTLAVYLWSHTGGPYAIDPVYYRYKGLIALVQDRYGDLVLALLPMAIILARLRLKPAKGVWGWSKSVLGRIGRSMAIGAAIIGLIGVVQFFLKREAFAEAGAGIIASVQLTYLVIGLAIGLLIGVALLVFDSLQFWLLRQGGAAGNQPSAPQTIDTPRET